MGCCLLRLFACPIHNVLAAPYGSVVCLTALTPASHLLHTHTHSHALSLTHTSLARTLPLHTAFFLALHHHSLCITVMIFVCHTPPCAWHTGMLARWVREGHVRPGMTYHVRLSSLSVCLPVLALQRFECLSLPMPSRVSRGRTRSHTQHP